MADEATAYRASMPRSSSARAGWLSALAAAALQLSFAWAPDALALDPALRVSQYGHTAWRTREGFFLGAPVSLAQTADGYLWLGTAAALVRFDGMTFETPVSGPEMQLPNAPITALFGARDGSLWIGSRERIARLHDGRVRAFALSGVVNAIVGDPAGSAVWIVRTRASGAEGALCAIDPSLDDAHAVRCLGARDGITLAHADHLLAGSDDSLWIGGAEALLRWQSGSTSEYFRDRLRTQEELSGISGLARDLDGSVWAALPLAAPAVVLEHFVAGRWTQRRVEAGGPPFLVTALRVDRDGSLWIGTDSRGVFRLAGSRLDHFGSEHGLSGDRVVDFFDDSEGNVWVLTTEGIDCLRDIAVVTFSHAEGLSSDDATVVSAHGNEVEVGNGSHLDRIVSGGSFEVDTDTALRARQVTAIANDGDRLWVGADNAMMLRTGRGYRALERRDGSPLGFVEVMTVDAGHDAWMRTIGAEPRLIHVRDATRVDEYPVSPAAHPSFLAADPVEGIWTSDLEGRLSRITVGRRNEVRSPDSPDIGPVHASDLSIDEDGVIWLATQEGLVEQKGAQRQRLDERNGLPCDHVFAIALDRDRAIWLYAACGIIGIERTELDRWWENPSARIAVRHLDAFDGAAPARSDFSPHATRTEDGRLWFANGSVVQMVDPARIPSLPVPPIHIERASADHRSYPVSAGVRLPPLTRDIEIDYSAPTFTAPRKVEFRYLLAGRDPDWQDAGTQRKAFFSGLAPGHYIFHVSARQGSGAWSAPDSLDIDLAAAFWQTHWFQLIALAALSALATLLYRRRLRRVAALVQSRFEGRMAERERIARELHDTLLQSIQGLILNVDGVARRLPKDDAARGQLESALVDADAALVEGRDRVHEMRAQRVEAFDLPCAVETLIASLEGLFTASFHMTVEGRPRALNPVVGDEVYWIVREAMINAGRHAGATRVEASIAYEARHLRVSVRDDGIGFGGGDIAALVAGGHYGLSGMHERAASIKARLSMRGCDPDGTAVDLSVPGRVAYDLRLRIR